MDVKKLLIGGLCSVLWGCANPNSVSLSNAYVASAAACTSSAIPNNYVVKWKTGAISVEKYSSPQEMQQKLGAVVDQIEAFEDDHLITIEDPNRLRDEVGLTAMTAADPSENWGQSIVQASTAYAQNIYGAGVKVAIVDTGIDITHPQLAGQMAINVGETGVDANGNNRETNHIDDDGNGYIDDVYGYDFVNNTGAVTDGNGHGTHVSGIVAADPNLGSVQGIAPKAQLIDASFMDSTGSGSMGNAALAIQYAVKRGAKVINASWGGDACSNVLRQTISSLEGMGVMFVVAAGNGDPITGAGFDIGQTPVFPASFGFEGELAVGASGVTDRMASFSNFSTSLVQLLAPGVSIISTWPGNTTQSESGTSMATPFVSGTVALLMGAFPNATLLQIKQAINAGVDQGNFPVVSSGRLNIGKAITALKTALSK
jgi:subtilisin family serine protease